RGLPDGYERRRRSTIGRDSSCFNEAADEVRRKDHLPFEVAPEELGFNEAADEVRRKVRQPPSAAKRPGSFNEAADAVRRKGGGAGEDLATYRAAASMRPPMKFGGKVMYSSSNGSGSGASMRPPMKFGGKTTGGTVTNTVCAKLQ